MEIFILALVSIVILLYSACLYHALGALPRLLIKAETDYEKLLSRKPIRIQTQIFHIALLKKQNPRSARDRNGG